MFWKAGYGKGWGGPSGGTSKVLEEGAGKAWTFWEGSSVSQWAGLGRRSRPNGKKRCRGRDESVRLGWEGLNGKDWE